MKIKYVHCHFNQAKSFEGNRWSGHPKKCKFCSLGSNIQMKCKVQEHVTHKIIAW